MIKILNVIFKYGNSSTFDEDCTTSRCKNVSDEYLYYELNHRKLVS